MAINTNTRVMIAIKVDPLGMVSPVGAWNYKDRRNLFFSKFYLIMMCDVPILVGAGLAPARFIFVN
ncbi:MAG: hypothetical protein DRG27_04840 [Deltaproteobacteria bacterium]|nr:MAG: hypothetical protein DRG27_04840 [Deltaproteobacteria bacterium]